MFTGSAFLYAIQLVLAHCRLSGVGNGAAQATEGPANTHSPPHRHMKVRDETSG
jgi:hypothetical protein